MSKRHKAERKQRRRRHRAECIRKIGYRSRKEAHAARRRLEGRGESGLHVYACPHCGRFHVGHCKK